MYSTTAYLYQQITRVLLVDTSGGYFTARYDPVYAKTLTINQGVDNVLLFEFINQDQKPVNVTGSEFVFRLISQDGNTLLLEKNMTVLAPSVGRAKVEISAADTTTFTAQTAGYSVDRTAGNYQQAVYVDDNSQARGVCNIVGSVFPDFVASAVLTIPDIYGKRQQPEPGPTNWPDWALEPQPVNTTQLTEYYSSFIEGGDRPITTVQLDLDTFTGELKFQAANDYLATWVDVTPNYSYRAETGTQYFNITGYYPLLRMAINTSIGYGASATAVVSDAGVLTGVTVDYPGSGYVARPRVQILGNGAGATAEAVINDAGIVTGVVVTAGGSGYTPIQFQGLQRATVLIDNGTINNIRYR